MLELLLPCSTCCSLGCVPQGLLAQLRETQQQFLIQYPQHSHRELGLFLPRVLLVFFILFVPLLMNQSLGGNNAFV